MVLEECDLFRGKSSGGKYEAETGGVDGSNQVIQDRNVAFGGGSSAVANR
jgi:hypothetical protein